MWLGISFGGAADFVNSSEAGAIFRGEVGKGGGYERFVGGEGGNVGICRGNTFVGIVLQYLVLLVAQGQEGSHCYSA